MVYAHVTGAALLENIPRMVPEGLRAKINKDHGLSCLFNLLQNTGNIEETDMFNTFNMGIEMVLLLTAV